MASLDPGQVDPTKGYMRRGDSLKLEFEIMKALYRMTNNDPNALTLRTVEVCLNNATYRTEIICTTPRKS